MSLKVVIIGAGLFGSVIAATLRRDGHKVTVIDGSKPNAGSRPAACLMKPSWAGSLTRLGEYGKAIQLLDELYGVQTLQFTMKPTGIEVPLQWVDPTKILVAPDISANVVGRSTGHVVYHSLTPGSDHVAREQFDVLILATGAETPSADLTHGVRPVTVKPLVGWAFTFPGQLDRPQMRVWSPYKQLMAFNIAPDRIWVGDGTSLIVSSATEERMRASLQRCATEIGADPATATIIRGHRPKVEGLREPALIDEITPGTFHVTGGAKNGTLGAAWAARQLSERLKC